ncbi:hypothetical protein SSX86_016225 [Deinandra increscens subsp. villosa]|uniref:DNA-binding protein BIN4 n=1 Tax=Deinandra increscens subsp. villosa TaxID=3103831 RepID=A0AAP0GVG2_9ASTR
MSTSSREYSPDWLRNVQGPAIFTLSSSSESLRGVSEDENDDELPISSVIRKAPEPSKKPNTKRNRLGETEDNKGVQKVTKGKSPKTTKAQEHKSSDWKLESDSEHELSEGEHLKVEDDDVLDTVEETSLKRASKLESSKKRLKLEDTVPAETKGNIMTEQENDDDDDQKVLEKETTDGKQTGSYMSSSRLPLVLADKVQRSKVLVECEGDSIDLSGDLGSVGRVVISESPSGNQDMLLDLKGTIYKTTIMPSSTLCVVSFGQSEAKIEAIMNDFIQLKAQSNVYEAETMVEGTLEGFSFESEDEGDKHAPRQTDENEGGEPQTNGKSKGKSEAAKKKGKTAVKKPAAKKGNKKKAPVAKKTKAKK